MVKLMKSNVSSIKWTDSGEIMEVRKSTVLSIKFADSVQGYENMAGTYK